MIALLRPQPNARSVGQPEPAALGLLMGNLQPLTLPDTLDPLVVDYPARLAQELGDLAIAIAAVLPGKLDNIGCETLLVVTTVRTCLLERCCPSAAQARRSETCSCARTCSMQARRRAGLEVSPRSLLQNELIQRQIGNRPNRLAELKVLQAVQPAVATSPNMIHCCQSATACLRGPC